MFGAAQRNQKHSSFNKPGVSIIHLWPRARNQCQQTFHCSFISRFGVSLFSWLPGLSLRKVGRGRGRLGAAPRSLCPPLGGCFSTTDSARARLGDTQKRSELKTSLGALGACWDNARHGPEETPRPEAPGLLEGSRQCQGWNFGV